MLLQQCHQRPPVQTASDLTLNTQCDDRVAVVRVLSHLLSDDRQQQTITPKRGSCNKP